MRQRKLFFNTQQVKTRRTGGGCSEAVLRDFAAKTLLLKVIKPCRPLNICEYFFRGVLQPFIHLTADQRPFELADKFFQMIFNHPVKINQFTVNIINNLCFTGRFKNKVQLPHRRGSHITGMGRK